MRNRIFAVLVLAILAGGGLAYGTYNVISNNQAPPAAAIQTTAVVVARGDLVLGAELKADDLSVVNFPKGAAPEGTFTNPADVIGRGVISPMVKGEIILQRKLAWM